MNSILIEKEGDICKGRESISNSMVILWASIYLKVV